METSKHLKIEINSSILAEAESAVDKIDKNAENDITP